MVLRMAKAINHFIDGYQIEQEPKNRSSSGSDASQRQDGHNFSAVSGGAQDEVPPSTPEGFNIINPSATEDTLDVDAAGGANSIVSRANTATEEDSIDSKDRRDRDLVYARASYLIREGLAMQGWSVYPSHIQQGLTATQPVLRRLSGLASTRIWLRTTGI